MRGSERKGTRQKERERTKRAKEWVRKSKRAKERANESKRARMRERETRKVCGVTENPDDQIYLFDFVWFQWRLHTSHSLTLLAIEWWITETLVVYKHFEVSQMKVHNCYKSRDCCIVLGYFFVTRLKCHIALVIVVMVWNCGKFNLNTFLNWVAIPKPNLIYPADINIDTDSIYIMYSTHNTYSSCK